MDYRWRALAVYNAEVERGIAHTPEYVELMRIEKAMFDAEHALPPCRACGRPSEVFWDYGYGGRPEIAACLDDVALVSLVEFGR